jgi:hypothetical protein
VTLDEAAVPGPGSHRWVTVTTAFAIGLVVAWLALYVAALAALPAGCAREVDYETSDAIVFSALVPLTGLMFALGPVCLVVAVLASLTRRLDPPSRGSLLAIGILLLATPFIGTWILEGVASGSLLERVAIGCLG